MKKIIIALMSFGIFIGDASAMRIEELPDCPAALTLVAGTVRYGLNPYRGHTEILVNPATFCNKGNDWCYAATRNVFRVVARNEFITPGMDLTRNLDHNFRACGETYLDGPEPGIHFVHSLIDDGYRIPYGWSAIQTSDDPNDWQIWSQ